MSASPIVRFSAGGVAASRGRLVALALAVVWSVWGSTYLAMRVAVDALPPWGMAGSRFVVAGLVLFGIARLRGEPSPSLRSWLVAVPAGFLLFFVGNGLVAVGEQSLASGLAAVVCATTPLVASAIAAIRPESRPTRAELVGMALGFAGVAVLALGSPVGGSLRGLLIVLAPVGFALGSLLARADRAGGTSSVAAQMLAGGVSMLLASAFLGERLPANVPGRAMAAWAYLVVFGSIVGFTAYSWLLRNARTSVAMSHAYVNPIVAVVLGAALGGERLGIGAALSTILIATGVVIALRRPRPPTNVR